MIDGLVGEAIEAAGRKILELLQGGQETAIQMAFEAINSTAVPSINNEIFSSLYVRVWGFAIVVALLTTIYGLIVAIGSHQRRATVGKTAFHSIKVYVMGMLLPMVVSIGLYISNLLVEMVLLLQPEALTAEAWIPANVAIVDVAAAIVVALINWVLSWTLAIWLMFLVWAVYPLLIIAIAMLPLAPIGKDPKQVTRRSYTWLAAIMFATPVAAGILVLGYTGAIWGNETGSAVFVQVIQSLFIAGAIYGSWKIRKAFQGSQIVEAVLPAPLVGFRPSHEGTSSIQTHRLQNIQTAVREGRHWHQTHSGERGKVRRTMAAGMHGVAAVVPDPRVKTALAWTGHLAQRSAERAQNKETSHV